MKGEICPNCKRQAFRDEGSHRKCTKCGFIGWSWRQPVKGVGKGKGEKCPNCSNQTLHEIITLQKGEAVRRCGVCDFSCIYPAQP